VAFPARLPARWLTAFAARLTFMSGVGYVAMAYTASRFLTKPRRRPLRRTPADFGIAFTPLEIVAEDGIRLAGWVVEPPEARATVALFHGMRRNREQMLSRIAFLAAAGYRCVAVDLRAHGQSAGTRISFGWYEARDVRAVARWIEENHPGQPRFALGISMGAAAICFAGPQCRWRGIVLESVYADLKTAFKRRIEALYPRWFGELCPGTVWITQKRLRVQLSTVSPADAIREMQGIRILGLTGTLDVLAPPVDMHKVMKAVPGESESLVIDGAGHSDVFERGGEDYRRRIIEFLGK